MEQPDSVQIPSIRQRLFVAYFSAILIDLVVLNLFVEYSDYVVIDSFTLAFEKVAEQHPPHLHISLATGTRPTSRGHSGVSSA